MTNFTTAADGVVLAYDDEGAGEPVVLIHGFAAGREITWKNTRWYESLLDAGLRVIAIDCRGHGESTKPHDVGSYDEGRMASDIATVMDSCDVTVADVMGYSMGGYLAIRLMRDAPQRIRRVILGGVGETYFHFWEDRADMIADGLLAPDSTLIADATAREFRRFAEAAKNDLVALAACMRRSRVQFSCEQLAALPHPTLVVCGENDAISGSPEGLARCFRDARTLIIPGRNHHMTVGDRIYKEVVVQFLGS